MSAFWMGWVLYYWAFPLPQPPVQHFHWSCLHLTLSVFKILIILNTSVKTQLWEDLWACLVACKETGQGEKKWELPGLGFRESQERRRGTWWKTQLQSFLACSRVFSAQYHNHFFRHTLFNYHSSCSLSFATIINSQLMSYLLYARWWAKWFANVLGTAVFYVNVPHANPQGHLLQEAFPDLRPD